MRHICIPFVVSALALTAMTAPALAQSAPITYPAACESTRVSKADVERAHAVYLSGKQFLEESNYDKAIGYFNDAYSIDCSVHALLPIIATAFERKGDKAEAVRALEEYVRRAPNAPDHDPVERRIKNLKDQLARETPAAPPPATTPAPATTAPPAGTAPAEPPPSAPPPSGSPPPADVTPSESRSPLPWVLVGVGGASLVGGGILYLVGAGNVSSAENDCGGKRTGCSPQATLSGNNGRTLEEVGGVVAGVGLLATVGGVVWVLVANHHASKAATAHAAVSPVFAPGYAGLSFGGTL